ncbi:hypothetical protein PM082_024700 [Marasmius tenuissimus]|nr:hypothetical protein PM082_024700 [Marasmius tenuissimus]
MIGDMCSFIAEVVLSSRCFFIWNRRWAIVIPTALMFLAANVFGSIYGVRPFPENEPLLVFLGLDFMVHFLLTLFIAIKIVSVMRQANKILGRKSRKMYSSVLVIVIESGLLYPLSLVLVMSTPSDLGMIYVLIHVVGIAPTLVVVRVGLGNAFQDVASCVATVQQREESGRGGTGTNGSHSRALDIRRRSEVVLEFDDRPNM